MWDVTSESSFATAASKLNDSPVNTAVTVNYIERMSSVKITNPGFSLSSFEQPGPGVYFVFHDWWPY